jgi:hypothetical protein
MSKSYVIGNVVTLDYNDLVAGKDLSAQIAEAYGFDGIGVLTVKNVPRFVEARERLLPLARQFALLPEETKNKYVHEESHYSFGWSHGKEKLQGNFDLSKGSYYANPQFDEPIANPELIKKLSSFVHPNIWPSAQDCPDFEAAFKNLGRIMVEVGVLVAKQCDTFVHSNCSAYPSNKLETVIRESLNCKARLLHYFADAVNEDQNTSVDDFASWCGWHNDHGSLTGLTSALFVEEKTGRIIENTDPNAGKRFCLFSFFLSFSRRLYSFYFCFHFFVLLVFCFLSYSIFDFVWDPFSCVFNILFLFLYRFSDSVSVSLFLILIDSFTFLLFLSLFLSPLLNRSLCSQSSQ